MPSKSAYWRYRGRGLCVNCGMRAWEGTARCGPCQRRHRAGSRRQGVDSYAGPKQTKDGLARGLRLQHPDWTPDEILCAVNREWRKRQARYGDVPEATGLTREDWLRRHDQLTVYARGAHT